MVIIDKLSGLIGWKKNEEYSSVKLSEFNINIQNSLSFKDAKIELEVTNENYIKFASLNINRINLEAINSFILKLPDSFTGFLYQILCNISNWISYWAQARLGKKSNL